MRERRGFGGGGGRDGGGFRGGGGGGGFGRRDSGGFSDRPKPIKEGEEYNVKITDVGAKGDGITKIENFIVFVPGAKKGEDCRIKITRVSQRFAIGEKVGEATAETETEESEPAEAEGEESSSEDEEQ